eukprot:GHVU01189843.1.p2 GENE.GHVU01189843.1~~GHVU01189843.1.p2  ORF type:complete len:147 (+),score=12.93 GHVU01189843.1:560-1000(+)
MSKRVSVDLSNQQKEASELPPAAESVGSKSLVLRAERRVSTIMFQLGVGRIPVEGVLDSGASHCIMSISMVNRLREAGENVPIRAIPASLRATVGNTVQGMVMVPVRIMVYGDIWIEAGPVPFLIAQQQSNLVLIGEAVLEELERL